MNTELPKDWKVVKLSDVCKNITDGSHFSPKSQEDGYSYITVRDIDNDQIDFNNCKKISKKEYKRLVENGCKPQFNDLLFSKDGTVGKVTLVTYEKEFVVLSSLAIFTPDVSIISPKYLFFILKSDQFVRQALNQKKGVAIRRIILRDLKELKLNITSIPEQHRIVAKLEELLSELEKGKEQLHTALDQLKVYRQAVLKYAFEGKLTSKVKVNNGELPEGWKLVKLGEACDKIQDGSHFSPAEQYLEDGKDRYLYITAKNIRNNYMDLSKIIYINKKFHDSIYPRCNPEFGDVLLTKDGVNTGEVTLNSLKEPFSLLSSVCLFKTKKEMLSPPFLKYYIQSPIGNKNLIGQMTGTAIKRIILKKLKGAEIVLPKLEDQQRIVEEIESRLSVADKMEETINASLQQSETLRQSILKKAFEGKLV